MSIKWNSVRLSDPSHGIVTKTLQKTLTGGGWGGGEGSGDDGGSGWYAWCDQGRESGGRGGRMRSGGGQGVGTCGSQGVEVVGSGIESQGVGVVG